MNPTALPAAEGLLELLSEIVVAGASNKQNVCFKRIFLNDTHTHTCFSHCVCVFFCFCLFWVMLGPGLVLSAVFFFFLHCQRSATGEASNVQCLGSDIDWKTHSPVPATFNQGSMRVTYICDNVSQYRVYIFIIFIDIYIKYESIILI